MKFLFIKNMKYLFIKRIAIISNILKFSAIVIRTNLKQLLTEDYIEP